MFWLEQFLYLHWFDYGFIFLIIFLFCVGFLFIHKHKKSKSLFSLSASFFYFTLSILLFYTMFIEPNLLQTKIYQYDSPKVDLDQPIKLAVIGDLQDRAKIAPSSISHLVAQVNKTDSDYIIWVGDLVENTDPIKELEQFSNITAKNKKIAVLGNHDYRYQVDDPLNWPLHDSIEALLKRSGFEVLENKLSVDEVKGTLISFVGTPDIMSDIVDHEGLNLQTELVDADLNIFISHQPKTIEDNLKPHLYDIILSGHCHGGQVNFGIFDKFFGLPRIPRGCFQEKENIAGLFKKNNLMFLITPGVGSRNYRMRFLRPPEISVLEIY